MDENNKFYHSDLNIIETSATFDHWSLTCRVNADCPEYPDANNVASYLVLTSNNIHGVCLWSDWCANCWQNYLLTYWLFGSFHLFWPVTCYLCQNCNWVKYVSCSLILVNMTKTDTLRRYQLKEFRYGSTILAFVPVIHIKIKKRNNFLGDPREHTETKSMYSLSLRCCCWG